MEITPEMLTNIFDYNPETGILTRRRTGRVVSGTNGGSGGYLTVNVLGSPMYIHRVAFAIVNGRLPAGEVDHVNGVKTDNRIANLRVASRSENGRNVSAHRDSKTGVLGVCLEKRSGKYLARIKTPKKTIHLGLFDTAEEAAAARKTAEAIYHGEFASHISRKLTETAC